MPSSPVHCDPFWQSPALLFLFELTFDPCRRGAWYKTHGTFAGPTSGYLLPDELGRGPGPSAYWPPSEQYAIASGAEKRYGRFAGPPR